MSILSFIRDTAYFQSRRDQQMMINAEDFDLQFNNLTNYINKKLLPIIDNLSDTGIAVGTDEENTANTFLHNIGDGNTDWAIINNDAIDDYSITFSKIAQSIPGSIFATAVDRIFRTVTPTDNNLALISTANNLPVWQRLKGENFEDRQILGNNIAYNCIGNEHLSPQIIGRPLEANSIFERHIRDQNITGIKIANGAILARHFLPEVLAIRTSNINSGNFTFNPNDLTARHFPPRFFTKLKYQGFPVDFLPDGVIDKLHFSGTAGLKIPKLANGAIEARHIMPGSFPFESDGSYIVGLRKEKLHPSIRQRLGI